MGLLFGNLTAIPTGTFGNFEAYKDRSSKISLLPGEGTILCKDKPHRNKRRAIQEFAALQVWHLLLGDASAQSKENGKSILRSPRPLAIDDEKKIYMTYETGVEGNQAMSGNYLSSLSSREEKIKKRLEYAELLGKLMRVKDEEKLAHGDFQLRHTLFDPAAVTKLTVIDVENSHISESKSRSENQKARKNLLNTVKGSRKWQQAIEDHLEKGYETPTERIVTVQEAIDRVRSLLRLPEFDL